MALDLAGILALITDADASTTADDVRNALRALYYRGYGIDADPGPDDIYWDGDAAGMTEVNITGSQTIVESGGRLSVRYNSQASGDVGALLKPVTFAVGDKWRVPVGSLTRSDDFSIMSLLFTDGTAASSKFVAATTYTTNTGLRYAQQEGTLTALVGGGIDVTQGANDRQLAAWLELEYVAANTFAARFGNRVLTTNWGAANRSFTMTPTHIGVGWTKNGGTLDAIAEFGPLVKVA